MKPKVRRVYLKLLALASSPFILSGCSKSDCNVSDNHVHRYVGKNNRGTIVNYFISEDPLVYQWYEDGSGKHLNYEKQDDYLTLTKEDEEFYKAKGSILFKGEDNWDYLFKIMSAKKDHIEYYYRYDDGLGGWNHSWKREKPSKQYYFAEKIRVYHYQFCGHKLTYKDGKWVDERSPFVNDIREIIDEYPYFQLDCYKQVYKEFKVKRSELDNIRIEDFDDFTGPDLSNPELHPNQK